MRITLCQLNSVMGDIAGNTRMIAGALARVAAEKPDLVVFTEMFIQGYPPRDLLERKSFVRRGQAALGEILALSKSHPSTGILVGTAAPNSDRPGKGLSNAAVLIHDGRVVFRQDKSLLPTYDIFDEARYFDPARTTGVVEFRGERLGITICEDAWNHADMMPRRQYAQDPVEKLASMGATLIVNIAASPFHAHKERLRFEIMQRHAVTRRLPFVFVNQVGGNDDLVFDGGSMVLDSQGRLRAHLGAFCERVLTVDTGALGPELPAPEPAAEASVYDALVLGTRDYVRKCGFTRAFAGLSGGIDSALVACIASAAVGPENVTGVTMPSRYSSRGSIEDSRTLARNLGIEFREIDVVQEPQAMEFLRSQGHRTIPQIYWDGRLFVSGGWQGLRKMSRDDILTAIEILETRSLGTL